MVYYTIATARPTVDPPEKGLIIFPAPPFSPGSLDARHMPPHH